MKKNTFKVEERYALKPLSGAPFKWRPGHVSYLPYPRYATASMVAVNIRLYEW
jgi:hypothetical protein